MQISKVYSQEINKGSIDMTLSVNPLGCSPRAIRALKKITESDISLYPDTSGLNSAIAKKFNKKNNEILLGNGSEQLIKLISQTFLNRNDLVVVPRGSFVLFSREPRIVGATVKLIAFEQITSFRPRLVFIANPGTPTGEVIPLETLAKIFSALSTSIIVIDEANGEFNDESCIGLIRKFKNLIVLRTFSKAFGLAGLRIAFAIGSAKNIKKLKNIQQPFPVSTIAIRAAQIALDDTEFIEKTKKFISKERIFLSKKISALGLTVSNSVTNNLFIGISQADDVIQELNKRNVSVINGTFFPGMKTPGFRISIKDKKTNRLFLKKFAESIACINKKTLVRSRETL